MKRRVKFIGAGAAALLLIGGGVSYAAIPDSDDGEIHGCRDNTTGDLRVIDAEAGASCGTGETALDWNKPGLYDFSTTQDYLPVPSNSTAARSVSCPTGKTAINGHWGLLSQNPGEMTVTAHGATSNRGGWRFTVDNSASGGRGAWLYVDCAKVK